MYYFFPAGCRDFESFEKCHFEERERREIFMTAVCSRFLPSVEMTKMAVIQSSHFKSRLRIYPLNLTRIMPA